MAVVSCKLMPTGRSLTVDEGLAFSYGLTYQVRTNNPNDDARAVLDGYLTASPDPGPNWMAPYIRSNGVTDGSSFARRFVCTQPRDDTPTLWTVEVGFTPLPRGEDPTYTLGSPLQAAATITGPPAQVWLPPVLSGTGFHPVRGPARYRIEQRTVTRIVEADRDGNPIVNSAGQPFDEPVEEEYELEVYVFRFRVATGLATRALNLNFTGRLNHQAYLGYPAEHLLCGPFVAGEREYAAGFSYWTVEVRLLANDKPWRREFVDRGWMHFRKGTEITRELVLATNPLVDENGAKIPNSAAPCSEPVLLTDVSTPPAPGASITPGPGFRLSDYHPDAVGNIKKFAIRGTANFTQLPFNGAIPA